MKRRVRWGVIGAGGIARRRTIPEGIVPAENAELVAVFSPNSGAAVAEQFGVSAARSEAELLAREIDAVYIASPVNQHLRQVELSARARKHILCEKPLGLNVAEAERMLALCRDHGVKFGTAFMMRFHRLHVAAKQKIDAGAIGRPVLGRAQLSFKYRPIVGAWRQDAQLGGGGSLMDLGGHCIDLLEMFFGTRVKQVSCMTGRLVHDYPVEDSATVLLRFASGAQGVVECFFNIPDNASLNRIELYGSGGSILAEQTIGQGAGGRMTLRTEHGGEGEAIIAEPVNLYRAEIEAFSRAVLNDEVPPVDGDAGLWSQRVIAACYQSAAERIVVSL
jgi:predicted dehydrogenase